MLVALFTLAIGGGIGTAIGLVSGYFGGRIDAVLMRSADSTLAFPIILFAILLVVAVGPNMANVVIAIALVLGPLCQGHTRRGSFPEGAGLHWQGAGGGLFPF
jgi:ABC-type dipeptide/oligopeptide/nickel transport system permease subunit